MASSVIKAASTVGVGAAMVAVGAAKAMKTLASNGLFTDFPIGGGRGIGLGAHIHGTPTWGCAIGWTA